MKRNFMMLVVIVVVLIFAVSCTSKSESMISEAESALNSGEYEKAISICDKAIDSGKDDAELYGIRGRAYYLKSDYAKAVDDCEKAVSLKKDYVYDALWKSYLKQKNIDKAVNTMEACIKAGQATEETYTEVIKQYEKKGEYKKARDMKWKAYREEAYEQFFSIAVSSEVASDEGGFFVKSDDKFYPLQECGDPDYISLNPTKKEHMVYTYNDAESIPSLCDGDTLVLFTKDGLDEAYCSVAKVQKQGYTLPVSFRAGNAYGLKYVFPIFNSDSEVVEETLRAKNVESINGLSYDKFVDKYVFGSSDICSEDMSLAEDPVYLADLKKGESVEFKYHSGSSSESYEVCADIGYYCFDMHNAPKKSVSLTDQSYAVVDTASLENGTYVLKLEDNDGYTIHNPYLFKVTK